MNAPTAIQPGLLPILGLLIGAVIAAPIIGFFTMRRVEPETRAVRRSRLYVWCILALTFAAALALGRLGVCVFFAAGSALAMREYLRLVDSPRGIPEFVGFGGLVVATYGLLFFGRTSLFLIGVPLAALVVVSILALVREGTTNIVPRIGRLFWGVLFIVWGVGHVAMYYQTVSPDAGAAGPAGWIVLVLVLTEMNDISQAVTGRTFQRRRAHYITPRLSPRKTWEGLLGGIVCTVALAVVLTPWLTDLGEVSPDIASTVDGALPLAVALGLLIAVGGFVGDINVSALKRRAGVKDAGRFLGAMGGVLDRIDSLTVTAPLAAWFMMWTRA